ncbi:hypothetical protein Salat_0614500 [Sesamum alatum]|uniref:Uncharacterized protein n=1 Tax=Sesamum alatum TaxID=300844 RepID=A0AAE1YQV1_9LAMI|nr:hypothetical protein Salat_0614500 [Sesamum alatum]
MSEQHSKHHLPLFPIDKDIKPLSLNLCRFSMANLLFKRLVGYLLLHCQPIMQISFNLISSSKYKEYDDDEEAHPRKRRGIQSLKLSGSRGRGGCRRGGFRGRNRGEDVVELNMEKIFDYSSKQI